MKQFIKILTGMLVIVMIIVAAVACVTENQGTGETETELVEDVETTESNKKPYIPPIIIPEDTDPPTTEKPEIPEETGPLSVETDSSTDFFGAVDMH